MMIQQEQILKNHVGGTTYQGEQVQLSITAGCSHDQGLPGTGPVT